MKTTQKLGLFATAFSILVFSVFLGFSSANASEGIQSDAQSIAAAGNGTQQTVRWCKVIRTC